MAARQPGTKPALDVLFVGVLCALALGIGWRLQSEYVLQAEFGLGYGLGVFGLGAMLLLLLYSVRKHVAALRNVGPIRRWFHIHMMLGLIGPTAIILHSNFQSGSRNATVALVSMLLVAGSGIVGRFLYTKIHYEYLGRKATIAEMRAEASSGRGALASLHADSPELASQMSVLEERLLAPAPGPVRGMLRFLLAGFITRRGKRQMIRILRRTAPASSYSAVAKREANRAIREYTRRVRRASRYSGYERVFSGWHILHLPLCVLLFLAAFFHVLAVHMF